LKRAELSEQASGVFCREIANLCQRGEPWISEAILTLTEIGPEIRLAAAIGARQRPPGSPATQRKTAPHAQFSVAFDADLLPKTPAFNVSRIWASCPARIIQQAAPNRDGIGGKLARSAL
jgi:hypothetical protein